MVCKLNKSLYGLKQATRQSSMKFDSFICKSDFHRSENDHCYYFKKYTNSYVFSRIQYEGDKHIFSI